MTDDHESKSNVARRLLAALLEGVGSPQVHPQERVADADEAVTIVLSKYPSLPFDVQLALARRVGRRIRAARAERAGAEQRRLRHYADSTPGTGVPDPSIEVESRDLRRALYDAIVSRLTPQEREAIFRRFFRAQRLADVAKSMGVSVATTHRLVASGLATLQRALGDLAGPLGGRKLGDR